MAGMTNRTAGWMMRLLTLQFAAAVAMANGPVVLTPRFSTRDAMPVTANDHGQTGQNLSLDWVLAGPAPISGNPALYFFGSSPRDDGRSPPRMAWMDLTTGKLMEIYAGDRITIEQRAKAEADIFAVGAPDAGIRLTLPWLWGPPRYGTVAPDGRLYLAMSPAENASRSWPVVIYDPASQCFTEWVSVDVEPVGVAYTAGRPWLMTADGRMYSDDILGGLEPVGRVPAGNRILRGLATDSDGYFYTLAGPAPWEVWRITMSNNGLQVDRLLEDQHLDQIAWIPGAQTMPRLRAVIRDAQGVFSEHYFGLQGGQTVALQSDEPWELRLGEDVLDIITDFTIQPTAVRVRIPDGAWKRHPVVFSRVAWDRIKTLIAAPDGSGGVYGAGWPTAWIWRFDPDREGFRIFGRHYVIYRMHTWRDEIWATGYWGVKLLRWRPEEPWTFDYERHYSHKRYPGNTSPWGDMAISNPRLVCKFRYLKQLNVRRPGSSVITDNGWLWVGAVTPTVEHFNSRFGGAVNWYDPHRETIGRIAEPFVHHSVRAVSRAGSAHVAAAASQYVSPFEPLPPDFSPGKFILIDIKNLDVVFEASPLDAPLSYAAEGEPGRVVVYGEPGRYAGEGVRGALFIFDMDTMQVTHIVRMPVRMVWMEYDNSTRFERGPDGKIYFYGRDEHGVALCRVDSRTGEVEPVLRGKHITDVSVYNNAGAPFAFTSDRVYFGARRLVSVPLETVTGPLPEEHRTPTAGAGAMDFSRTDPVAPEPASTVDVAPSPPVQVPAIQRLVWRRAQHIAWNLEQGPAWYSMGHLSRVLTCVPKDTDGRPQDAGGASARVPSVELTVYEVTAFDDATGLPADIRRLTSHTIRADDPEAHKQPTWRFPSETPIDWEYDRFPGKLHQSLFRMFLHDNMPVWQTLMGRTAVDPAPADDAQQGDAFFSNLYLHGMVFELLHDPDLPQTSQYIEPDDPPSRHWWSSEAPPPAWIRGREVLAPAWGSLAFEDGDRMQFLPPSERAVSALNNMADKTDGTIFPEIGDMKPEDLLNNRMHFHD